jgi:RNA polymerase-binding transcription factor DksA
MAEQHTLREQLLARLAHLERRLQKVETDRRRGTNALEQDWEEQATIRQNDEVLDELAEEEQQQIQAIRAALTRIAAGTYGQCSTCGELIAAKRLEALPYATQCVTCAAQREHGRPHGH